MSNAKQRLIAFDSIERQPPAAESLSWEPFRDNGILTSFTDVRFVGGWRIHRISVSKQQDPILAAGVPIAAQLGANNITPTDANGRRVYIPIFSSADIDAKPRWDTGIIGTGLG